MVMDIAREALGWVGSVLLVVSLLQSRMLALRVLNLIAALLLIAYNIALNVWPSVAMNAAVALIDSYYLIAPRVRRDQRAESAPDADERDKRLITTATQDARHGEEL